MPNYPYAPPAIPVDDPIGQLQITDKNAGGVTVTIVGKLDTGGHARLSMELDFRGLLDLRDQLNAVADRQLRTRMTGRD